MRTRANSITAAAERGWLGGRGVQIGRLGGVLVTLDWSLLIVFALITVALSLGPFPTWHPDWGTLTVWSTAVTAAVLFIASVLVHELSHAVVGRRLGIDVRHITLFVFGGMAHSENDARGWGAELATAVAGPLASLGLGIAFLFVGGFVTGPDRWVPEDPMLTLSQAGPVATIFFWLGPVNILLGLLNMMPGFPLDGGRALRAVLWGATGDILRATRWAAAAGQGLAWLLIASGVAMILGVEVPVLGRGPLAGLWVAVVGWFLNKAAKVGYKRLLVQERLGDLPVTDLMDTSVAAVPPRMTVAELIDTHTARDIPSAFPVIDGNQLCGLVYLADARRVDAEHRATTYVDAIMTPARKLVTLPRGAPAVDALRRLTERRIKQIAIVDDGRFLGLVTQHDIIRWLSSPRRTRDDSGAAADSP